MESYEHPEAPIFTYADRRPNTDADVEPARIIPLNMMTFVLAVPLPPNTQCILELVSSRCLASGQLGIHPSEYQFSLFCSHFQTVLEEKKPGMELDMETNKVHWTSNGVMRVVESQHDFEIAITDLYNERASGWELPFMCLSFLGDATEQVVGEEITGKEIGEGHLLNHSVYPLPDKSISKRNRTKEGPVQGGVEPAASQKADTAPQIRTGNYLSSNDELGGGTMEEKIDYMITKTQHWGIDAEETKKRADQRVKAEKRKEKDGSMPDQVEKRSAHNTGSQLKPSVPQRSSSLKTPISQAAAGRPIAVLPKVSVVINRKPVPLPTNISSFQQTPTTRAETSSSNTSNQSSPYIMANKEHVEKTTNARRQFPAPEMPSLQATVEALNTARGNIDEAFLLIGDTPKKNAVPLKSRMRGSAKNVGGQSQEANPVSKSTVEDPQPEPLADTGGSIVLRKRSLSRHIRRVAHVAGRRLSIGGSKTRGTPPQDPSEVEATNYEFTVIREQAYKSGGDDEDAVNPLNKLRTADERMVPYEMEESEKAEGKAKDVASLQVTDMFLEDTSANIL